MTVFIGVVKALYDYDPQTDEELSIREGDLLYLLEKSDIDEWWTVKKRVIGMDAEEPTGLVPSNYVDPATVIGSVRALYDYEEAQNPDEEITFRENEVFDLFDDNDKDWLLVQSKSTGSYGFIPGNYVEPAENAQGGPITPAAAPEPVAIAPGTASPAAPAETPVPMAPPVMTPVEDLPPPPQRVDREATTTPANPAPTSDTEPPLPRRPTLPEASPLPSPSVGYEPEEPPLPSRPRERLEQDDEELPPPKPVRPTATGGPGPNLGGLASAGVEVGHDDVRSGARPDYMGLNSSDYHTWIIAEVEGRKKRKCKLTIGGRKIYFEAMDGYPEEWTIDKLTSYDHEKKHIFLDFVEPQKSLELHAGSSSTCDEIMSVLGEYKGAQRDPGFREIEEASKAKRQANVVYDFRAETREELTVRKGQVVYIVNDKRSGDWWLCELIPTGKRGMVPVDCLEPIKEKGRGGGGFFDSLKRFTGSSEKYNAKQNSAKEAARKERDREREKLKDGGHGSGGWKDDGAQSLSNARRRSSGGPAKTSFPDPKKSRIWADRSDTFKVEAQFIGCTEGKIHLHKANGVKIAVAAEKLSDEDLVYVERVTGFSLDKFKSKSSVKKDREIEEQDRNLRSKELEELRMAKEMLNDERARIKEFTEEKPLKPPRPQKTGGSNIVPNTAPNTAPNTVTLNYQPQYDWFEFFLNCGVDVSNCQRYTINFEREKLAEDMMKDINEPMLRTLGLREGDIVRVMKYLDKKFDREPKLPQSQPTGGMFSKPDGSLKVSDTSAPPAPPLTQNLLPQASAPEQPTTQTQEPVAPPPVKPPVQDVQQKTTRNIEDDAWTSKPAANSESAASGKDHNSNFTGSMQDLIDLRPLEPKKKEPSAAPEPNIKDLKPVETGATPLSSAQTGGTVAQLNPFKTGGNNVLPVVMMPVPTGSLMSMQTGGGLVLPTTTFGAAQNTGSLMQPQKTSSQSIPLGMQMGGDVSQSNVGNSRLTPMNFQMTGSVNPSINSAPMNLQTTGGVNTFGSVGPMSFQTTGGVLRPQSTNPGIMSNITGGPMQAQRTGAIPQTTFGSQPMGPSMEGAMPFQRTGVSMPKLGSVLPVQKTGSGLMPLQPTGGGAPMLATGSAMPMQKTGGLVPLQRTGGMPMQPTGNLVPLQRTGGMPMQPTGNLVPLQRTGGMPMQATGSILPFQRTGSNMMPQTSFGGSQVTGGANMMPQTSFGGMGASGNVNMMPQTSFGAQVTGGASMIPQTSFGGSQVTGGANVMPQMSFAGSHLTGGANMMPQTSFGNQQITGGANMMPQASNYAVQQMTGGANMVPQTSFGGPQMTNQFPQASFGVGTQSGMVLPGQQMGGSFQQGGQFGAGGAMPQQSFGTSFNTGIDTATQGMQNMSLMQTPLQAQPTGFGFGNGPQQPQQPQQSGARQANLFNATPDNPFGF